MTDGPTIVPVVAPVARLGRHRLFVVGVERWPAWFEVRWALVPGAARLVPSKLWAFSYEWTVRDDRGAAYARDGATGGGGPLLLSGAQRFTPALHPAARALALELHEPSGQLAASTTIRLDASHEPPTGTTETADACAACGRPAALADPSSCERCARTIERVLDALAAGSDDEPRRLVVVTGGDEIAGMRFHAVELWRRFAIVHANAPASLGFGQRPPPTIAAVDDRGTTTRGALHRTDTGRGVHHHTWLLEPGLHPAASTLTVEIASESTTISLGG